MPFKRTTRKTRNVTATSINNNGEDVVAAKKTKNTAIMETDEDYDDGSVFCELLRKAGIVLKTGDTSNELNVEHTIFYKNLTMGLKRHVNYPQVFSQFLDGLQQYIEERARFTKGLLPCAATEDSASKNRQPHSLIRLVLEVDLLQPKLIDILLEKLPEFMDDDESIFSCEEKINIPRQVLAQLQWLENIVDMTALREKLLEILLVTSLEVQREIISCLPEIMDVSEHAKVISVLKDLLDQGNSLTIPILDTLSNLVLEKDLLAEVLSSVLKILPSCEIDDLPVVVKFILQSVHTKDAIGVFSEMRNTLLFESAIEPVAASTPIAGPSTGRAPAVDVNKSSDLELLTMKSIHSCIQFQKSLAPPCIKLIDQVHGAAEHKVFDIFLLLILHSLNHTKAVESLFRNKIRAGDFTEKLLKSAFTRHTVVMQEYFTSILSLCVTFICSPESAVLQFSCIMYKSAFQVFDRFCQQEIIGNLVTHIGSGMSVEVDTALDILADLAENCLNLMAPFAIFVKGLLDYIDKLRISQIRKIYSAISKLAFHSNRDGGRTRTDLHIVIRKQLMSNKLKYKQNGIIGGVMLIRNVISISTGNIVSPDKIKDVITLLELMNTSSLKMASARALFMDELSTVISQTKLHEKVEEWIGEKVIMDFQDNYVLEFDKTYLSRESLLPLDFKYGLDEDVGENIAVSILPLFANKSKPDAIVFEDANSGQTSPLCLVPTFRLLGLCESQKDGSLDGIMALLGCPLCVMKSNVIDKMESLSSAEKEAICSTLFYALNWFREVINIFSTQKDPEVLGKVILRLHNITDVQNILEKCLASTPGYVPPVACFDVDEVLPPPSNESLASTTSTGGSKRGKKSNKRKKTKKNKDDCNDSTMAEDSSVLTSQTDSSSKDSSQTAVDLLNYHQYFRELKMNVLDILLVGKITSKALDSQMHTEAQVEVKIEPPQVEFLLKDLNRKLQHSLPASLPRRPFFLKENGDKNVGFTLLNQKSSEEIADKTIQLLPALCQQLEGASAFFQGLIAKNDGVLDGPGHKTAEAQCVAACFQLLIEILHCLFSWKDLTAPKNSSLMKSALSVLATRINHSEPANISLQQSFKLTVDYLYNFCDTSPNVQTAVKLTEILITLAEKGSSEQIHRPADLAEAFLRRSWMTNDGQPEKGAKFNKHIQKILKYYISHSVNPLEAIEKVSSDAIPELLCSNTKMSEMYPSLTTSSFSMFYRVLFHQLVITVKKIPAGKKTESHEIKKEKILQWNLAVRIFQILTTLIKKFDGLPNLGTALKTGRLFIDAFNLQAMPLLDLMYRSQHENIHSLLKSMQLSTRSLHHICSHSKIVKSVFLTNQIPLMKRSLEQLMFRVKVMLSMNNCEEGYMVGVLKNRNLMGDEILSQATVADTSANSTNTSTNSANTSANSTNDDQDDAPEEEVLSDEEDKVSDVEMVEAEEEASYSEDF